jgi:hypothetical protein
LSSGQIRRIVGSDRAEHGSTSTSLILVRTRARMLTVLNSGSTADKTSDPINRAKKIYLADADSVTTQDGVRYRHVEVRVVPMTYSFGIAA